MANVRDFGARGDGQADDTQALQHALQRGDGVLTFPRGDYLITRSL
jgi:polygalacturonase